MNKLTLTKTQKDFIQVYTESLGILSMALQIFQLREDVYNDWMDNPLFEEEINKIKETSLDFVENQLLKKVKEGDINAIKYYLATKGKHRGYN